MYELHAFKIFWVEHFVKSTMQMFDSKQIPKAPLAAFSKMGDHLD